MEKDDWLFTIIHNKALNALSFKIYLTNEVASVKQIIINPKNLIEKSNLGPLKDFTFRASFRPDEISFIEDRLRYVLCS